MPTTQPLGSLLALTHSVKAAAAVMLVGERWTRLSVVAGRDPKVKRREDDLVLRCEASLLLPLPSDVPPMCTPPATFSSDPHSVVPPAAGTRQHPDSAQSVERV